MGPGFSGVLAVPPAAMQTIASAGPSAALI
jgi:hypothetical protein